MNESAPNFESSTVDMTPGEFSTNTTTLIENFTSAEKLRLNIRSPALAVVLGLFCLTTVFGNLLVILAVYRERYLHSVTNYFIVSLATADFWVGAVVMPLGVVDEMLHNQWIFGQDWCDIWHSSDVLGSTASILHLCIISLDRYWAITDPMTYPCRMTAKKAILLIALVWVCSSIISFPAIAWWRAVSPPSKRLEKCMFTEQYGWYLVCSSTISFYGPLLVMVFTYYRVYRAAIAQMKCLKQGIKQVQTCNGAGREVEVTLRIHRGGSPSSKKRLAVRSSENIPTSVSDKSQESPRSFRHSARLKSASDSHTPRNPPCSSSRQPLNAKNFSFSRKLSKFAKEKTAAKTLGIVMGVFILCWLPFFVINVLMGLCGAKCVYSASTIMPVTTWLGWINSGMNPIIYACRSKDFRRAFIKILFCSKVNVGAYNRRRGFREVMHGHEHDPIVNSTYSSATHSECTNL